MRIIFLLLLAMGSALSTGCSIVRIAANKIGGKGGSGAEKENIPEAP